MTDNANPTLPLDAGDWHDDGTDDIAPPRRLKPARPARPASQRGGIGLQTLTNLARPRLNSLVEDARDQLVGQVRRLKSLADALSQTLGTTLGDNAHPVSHMIGQATGTIDTIADALAEKSVEELVEDGRELVRAQPVVAVGLAIAVGFLIGRIAKASQDS